MSPQAVGEQLPGYQNWATPRAFFDCVSQRLGPFQLDVCAEPWNAKCRRYYTAEQDGLGRAWGPDLRVWCNPPYGNPLPWLERGWDAAHEGSTVVYLLPASTDTGWFVEAARGDLYFVSGRLRFDAPPNYEGEAPGSNFGSVVVVYAPKHVDGRAPTCGFVDRQFKQVIPARKLAQMQLW